METRVNSFQNPIDLASSDDFSSKIEAYRAEILSDGHLTEDSRGFLNVARASEDIREAAPSSSWLRPDMQESNVANVFRRFLGGSRPPKPTVSTGMDKKVGPHSRPLFQSSMDFSEASAETEVMGSTGRSDEHSEMDSSTSSSLYYRTRRPNPEGVQSSIESFASSTLLDPVEESKTYGWRLDPAQSFSDWEIKIVSASGKTSVYNVHRMALAAGPRKSSYFADLFGKQVTNFKSQRLRLEMPDESAEVFPVFLDFVYGEDDLESVEDKEKAYAVYEQAEFFDTPLLKEAVTSWCRERLNWFNIPEFLTELERFEDPDPLVRMAVNMCAAEFEELGTDFGSKIEPRYLHMIFENLDERGFKFERGVDYISEMLLQSFATYEDMDEETFLKLTDDRFLPSIPVEAVLRLLAEEERICESRSEATVLQIRCTRSLSKNWEYFSYQFPSKDDMSVAIIELPKPVMAQLLVLTTHLP